MLFVIMHHIESVPTQYVRHGQTIECTHQQ